MERLLNRIKSETPQEFDYQWLGDFVKGIQVDELDFEAHLPIIIDQKKYSRNILTLDPFECVILHWPPKAESAIHYHQGFWGYVLCLKGSVENITYLHEKDKLIESRGFLAMRGGIIDEPEGVIHKIVNPSPTEPLVTLHFYYPALETLDGLKLYDPEKGSIGVLNGKAKTASFEEPADAFESLTHDAFSFMPMDGRDKVKSHRIYPIIPKPATEVIQDLISDYYKEQAKEYDSFDLKHDSRRNYNERINKLIAERLSLQVPLQRVVDLACGTGRRALRIKELTGRNYELCGIDLSEEMVDVATKRGLIARAGNWLDVEIPDDYAEALTFLYAYGHIPTETERVMGLHKVFRTLKKGGLLFMDVFNIDDPNEWGPQALKAFEDHQLEQFGYERGDVFYKKVGGKGIAFLHYCDESALRELLSAIGFVVESIQHIGYVHRSGEILEREEGGSLFVIARKPQD